MKHAGRRDRLRAVLPAGAAAMIVTSASNVRYLSGFTGSNGALLIAADPVHDRLGTDFRYVTQSVAQCPDLELVVARAVLPQLVDHAEELRLGPLAFEADHVSVAAHAALLGVHPRLPLLASSGLVEALRVVKDDSELALLARACRISDAALADLTPTVQVGQTEREIARRLEALMLDHGAEAVSFDTIVAGGPNSAVPHHRPTDRPLARGDLLKIDFGALYEGYHADETRTFVVGAPPQG
ncbi:MAG TPA: Xaa-Pro peptidase family protein, partial [Candidatus Nanopelagicales bacterium]|nr:Xaa-Pro peptidase family protein [Candidatus Nanopelagicales bacterium]